MTQVRMLAVAVLLIVAPSSKADELSKLREHILEADSGGKAGEAYEDYFTKLGRDGLKKALEDKDTGIALQAAWELNKKPIKHPKPDAGRTDDVYDPAELEKFLVFLKERTKADVPEWWAKSLKLVDLAPGKGHGFRDIPLDTSKWIKSDYGPTVLKGDKLEASDKDVVYTRGKRSLRFPADVADKNWDYVTGILGEEYSAITDYRPAAVLLSSRFWASRGRAANRSGGLWVGVPAEDCFSVRTAPYAVDAKGRFHFRIWWRVWRNVPGGVRREDRQVPLPLLYLLLVPELRSVALEVM